MAGKDIRRLVSAASPVSDMAKVGIIRRAMIGAFEAGASRVVVSDDRSALARRAAEEVDGAVEPLDLAVLSTSRDSVRAAEAMANSGVSSVIVLGGDGTHRDVAKGWREAPMVTLSTGTNNVFPQAVEATLAGHAAGVVATGRVSLIDVARQAKVIDVELDSGQQDLALVDLALTSDAFTGSRAVWNVASLRELVAAIAEPSSVGLSSIAAAVSQRGRHEAGGVHVRFGAAGASGGNARTVRCPIAPGRYETLVVESHRRLPAGELQRLEGPGALSFDGERDLIIGPDDAATVRISRSGPWVIDVGAALTAATRQR